MLTNGLRNYTTHIILNNTHTIQTTITSVSSCLFNLTSTTTTTTHSNAVNNKTQLLKSEYVKVQGFKERESFVKVENIIHELTWFLFSPL
jgi:spore germination protein GerM